MGTFSQGRPRDGSRETARLLAAREKAKETNGLTVVAGEVVDVGLGQHGDVLKLALAERGSVAGDDDKLRLTGTEGLAIDNQREPVKQKRDQVPVCAQVPICIEDVPSGCSCSRE